MSPKPALEPPREPSGPGRFAFPGRSERVMHIHVHRPVICQCKAEMDATAGWHGWFHCVICGTKRAPQ